MEDKSVWKRVDGTWDDGSADISILAYDGQFLVSIDAGYLFHHRVEIPIGAILSAIMEDAEDPTGEGRLDSR